MRRTSSGSAWLALALGTLGVALVARSTANEAAPVNPARTVAPPQPAEPPKPAALTLELTIGGKGAGPGLFTDPREVAPEQDGRFYVADYASGRVQKFDRAGKYLSLIAVEPGADGPYILDMAASSDGTLYVVRAGELLRFSTADGKKLGAVPPPKPGSTYRHLFVDPANNLYALSVEKDGKLGALSKFDRNGKLAGRWSRQTSGQEYHLAHDRIGVDGAGTMFITHHYGYFVEALDPKGAVLRRFGQEGDGPAQFRRLGMGSIDVDGHGHVLVANDDRISVFDVVGRFLGDMQFERGPGSAGFVRSFRVGGDGRLYGATNADNAVVYRLSPGAIEALKQ